MALTATTRGGASSKLQARIPPQLEHTPCKFTPFAHDPGGGHRNNTYWDVCGFFAREMFNNLPRQSTTSPRQSVTPRLEQSGVARRRRFELMHMSEPRARNHKSFSGGTSPPTCLEARCDCSVRKCPAREHKLLCTFWKGSTTRVRMARADLD
jgi:hypothetical protein